MISSRGSDRSDGESGFHVSKTEVRLETPDLRHSTVDGEKASRARILVADDNADMRDYVRRMLAPVYDVITVNDGVAALRAAHEHVPDLVLTDVMVPGLDGFGLLKELRADARLKTVPVIMLSARAGEEARVEGLEAGANDYVIKPFSAKELLARVGTHVNVVRFQREASSALRDSEERLRLALESAGAGMWDLNLETGAMVWSPENCRLYGLDPDSYVPQYATWRVLVHPDDLERVEREREEAMRARKLYRVEYRICTASTGVRWVASQGRAYYDADGRPVRMLGINIDITQRKQVEDVLREADRHKDEFLAMLGHELRNPLGIISTSMQILRRAAPQDARTQEIRDVIERQVIHTSKMLDDLLDVSRIARGKVQLHRQLCDFREIVRQTAEDYRTMLQDNGLRLALELPDGPVPVLGDRTRLAQVIGNLLHNSGKFTDRGGTVTVNTRNNHEKAILSVIDTGIGLEPGGLAWVFQPFRQADRTLDRSRGGLGLGLALVKGSVDLHDGSVSAASAGPGRGATFTIELPLHRSGPADRVVESDRRVEIPPCRVLIIEDNPVAARNVRSLLEMSGHTVECAASGPQGVEISRTFRPDVILCDIGLPGLDGYEVARALRQEIGLTGARLIAVSGYAHDQRRAAEAGFDAHFTKPLDFDALEAMLARMNTEPPQRLAPL